MRGKTLPALLIAALACSSVHADGPGVGDRAPAVSAASWANLPEGVRSLTQKDLKGRILMIDFWATW